ncbi:peptide chain release factor-like protein [Patescibacteria group bacterium]|nr:peptide chain release factor-like protein [Patescibacteria group bacterium]MBU0777115.1 peptide chain release factor-like protein [Patescibacteria group bacterium]MBU0845809.1 peptide chain release factor-like protein [Patescibacteria group bacterium]MBU0922836.1 peptide chain release factor-like protein [Patescibacteria group bacterium]MBU1066431.1 peptide chain release factor-like protein [Patescibacteria group bacterium]
MNSLNGEEWVDYSETGRHHRRARKFNRRKFPRDRSFVGKELKISEKIKGEEKRKNEARGKIEKHLKRFSTLDSHEGKKKIKVYIRWVRDSLDQDYPLLDEGDLEVKTAVASVKAGGQKRQKSQTSVRVVHLPTLIRVKNEEERSLEQNTLKAKENLYILLTEHLQLWKILNIASPNQGVEREVKDML